MSRTIDERVVSMQFDNRQFETNVRTSMSTLERLKQSLNLKGASDGLTNVSRAAARCDFAPLGRAADAVGLRFSAMYTVADQALRNMVTSAQHAANRIRYMFTVEPVKSGFQEYETQIGAIQTILSNTRHAGTDLDQVNAVLDELNSYADMTIYNFTQMTRNIGTFTAAGVDLQTSAAAIKGIANLAAISGSTSQQASTAMYQLSQALAAGRVSLMDWNSVVNAGMGGKVFQDALKRTAERQGKNVDALIKKYGSFRESLTQGEWLTTQVLTETLKQLSGAYTEAQLIEQGYTETQARDIAAMAKDAVEAATKVKTFTQLIETLKESAQSGWAQSWELIVGDFEESREMWSSISDVLGGMINKMSESRNALLEGALTSNWDKMVKKINEAGVSTSDFETAIEGVVKSHGNDVDAIIEKYGSWEKAIRSGAISVDMVKEALTNLSRGSSDLSIVDRILGWDDRGDQVKAVQQALVDLGYDIGTMGVDGIIGKYTTAGIKAFQEAQGLEVTGIIDEATLEALKKATTRTELLGEGIMGLVDGVTKLGGREMIIKSFANIFSFLGKILTPIKTAFRAVFPKKTPEGLVSMIEGFQKFTEKLDVGMPVIRAIHAAFKGFFSLLATGKDLIVGGVKAAFKLLRNIFSGASVDVSGLAEKVGEALTKFREWIVENEIITKTFDKVVTWISTGIAKIREWIKAFFQLPDVKKNLKNVGIEIVEIGSTLKKRWPEGIKKIKDFVERVRSMDGLTLENLRNAFVDFKDNVLGHFFKKEDGTSIFGNLGESVKSLAGTAKKYLADAGIDFVEFGSKIGGFFDKIKKFLDDNKGIFLGIGLLVASILPLVFIWRNHISPIITAIQGFGNALEEFSGVMNAVKNKFRAEAIKTLAESILILAVSIGMLTLLDPVKLVTATSCLGLIMILLVALTREMGQLRNLGDTKSMASMIAGLSLMLLSIAVAMNIVGRLKPGEFIQGMAAITIFGGMIVGLMAATKIMGSGSIDKFGILMIKLSASLLLFALVTKIFGSMDTSTLIKGALSVTYFLGLMVAILAATKFLPKNKVASFGRLMLGIAGALLLLGVATKVLGNMSARELLVGGLSVTLFLGLMVGLMAASKLIPQKDVASFGKMMLSIGGALILMAIAVKIFAKMKFKDLAKGTLIIAGFMGLMTAFAASTKLLGKNAKSIGKFGVMMLAFSGAMLVLAATIRILAPLSGGELAKATLVIAAIGAMFVGLMAATKLAGKVKIGTIITLTAAVAVLALAVGALSFADQSGVQSATLCLMGMMGMFGVLMVLSKFMGSKVIGTVMALSLVVGLFAGVIYLLDRMEVDASLKAVSGLCALILTASVACALCGMIGVGGALAGALGLVAFIGILGAFVAAVGWLNDQLDGGLESSIKSAIPTLEGLGTAIGTFAGSIFGSFGSSFATNLADIGTALSDFWTNLNPFITGISGLDTTVLTAMGDLATAILALTAAELLSAITGFISGKEDFVSFGTKMAEFGAAMITFNDTISGQTFDTAAMTALKDATVPFVELAKMLPYSANSLIGRIAGLTSLGEFGTDLATFGEQLNIFNDSVKDKTYDVTAMENIKAAVTPFVELAKSLPFSSESIMGRIAGLTSLGEFGADMSTFATELNEFNTAITGVTYDTAAMETIKNAVKPFVDLANELPEDPDSVAGKILGTQSLSTFASDLTPFVKQMKLFDLTLTRLLPDGLDTTAMTNLKDAITPFVELANALPQSTEIDVWGVKFTSVKSLGTFGTDLVSLAEGISEIATKCGTLELSKDNMQTLADAVVPFADLADELPTDENSWKGKFQGVKSLGEFGTDLSTFGTSLAEFSDAVTGENFDSVKITEAAGAAKALVDVADALPDDDPSWFESLLSFAGYEGENSMVKFSEGLGSLGEGIVAFNDALGTGDIAFDSTAVTAATSAIDGLVTISDNIPEGTAWWKKLLFGDDSMEGFSTQISALGGGIKAFSDSIADVEMTNVTSGVTAIGDLIALGDGLTEGSGAMILSDVGNEISVLGGHLYDFYDYVSDIDSAKMVVAMSSVKSLIDTASQISESNITSVTEFIQSFSTLGDSGVESFVGAFEGAAERAKTAGKTMLAKVILGVTSGKDLAIRTFKLTVSGIANSLKTGYSSFYEAGKHMATGFANGISGQTWYVRLKAKAMGEAAIKEVKSVLGIKSPSRVFYGLGDFSGQGFVNALNDYAPIVADAAGNMADRARSGLSKAISRITDVINSGMDTQPTIRPVLDLSGVESGASAISGMLGMKPSVGVMANVRSISGLAGNRQNGDNGEVVSAIKDLAKSLNGNSGNTYNTFGDVSYDDESSISNAVLDLVKAAKIERRK